MKEKTHTCEDCGAIHIYYWTPQASCARIVDITDGLVTKCDGKLIGATKTKQRKCGRCGKTGHNKRTCDESLGS